MKKNSTSKNEDHNPEVKYIIRGFNSEVEHFYRKLFDVCEIVFLKHGCGKVTIDGRQYKVSDKDLIIFNQNAVHSEQYEPSKTTDKLEYVRMGLYRISYLNLNENHIIDGKTSPIIPVGEISKDVDYLFEIASLEFVRNLEDSSKILEGILTMIFAWIGRYSQDIQVLEITKNDVTNTLAAKIKSYIKVHFCEEIALKDLAEKFYINQYYLSHLMKKHLGVSPMKYVTQLRMGEAQYLLYSTNYPVRQVAQMVGYKNLSHFFSAFKSNIGMTPTEFREESGELYY